MQPILTEKQKDALISMKNSENVFLTGPAGTGKTFILKYFIDWYKSEREENANKIFITSTTGLSAILVDGMTINRYSGIGIGDKDVDFYQKKICKMKSLKNRWLLTDILIIDEISMMNSDIFDKLEILARKIRKIDKPFGGIQIILSGDFLQLPPVKSDDFCFESFSWDDVINKTFYFSEIIRQDDNKLQSVLNNIRLGIVNEEVKTLLESCLNKNLENMSGSGIIPTLLFSKKNMVIEYNKVELEKLIYDGKETHDYTSYYEINKKSNNAQMIEDKNIDFYKDLINSQYQVDDKLVFTINSQVMLTVNMPEHDLANGSRGIIIDFTKDISNQYPVVLFLNGTTMIIKPHEYIIDEDSYIIKKIQIPLILSWAITIHKAQGMSLELVKTDIGDSIFEYGQAYVVLSRIKNIEGLSLIKIDYSKIIANPKVLKYYKKFLLEESNK